MKKLYIILFLILLILGIPNSAFALTQFYVDPGYGGANGAADGTVTKPWTTLAQLNTALASGGTVNNTLLTDDVTVWFAARTAASDTSNVFSGSLDVARTDTSGHRLTLDGMTKYNTNSLNPSLITWVTYCDPPLPPQPASVVKPPGPCPSFQSRFTVNGGSTGLNSANGTGSGVGAVRNDITVRGFKSTGTDQGATFGNVRRFIFEWNDVSNTGTTNDLNGPTGFDLANSVQNAPPTGGCGSACIGSFGNDITLRNNYFHDSRQETLYITGYYTDGSTVPTSSFVAHTNLTIENNYLERSGRGNNEANCIDIKDGQVNLIVRGNWCAGSGGGVDQETAIVSESGGLFEGNFVTGGHSAGIALVGAYKAVTATFRTGAIIRNNVIIGVIPSQAPSGGGDYDTCIFLGDVHFAGFGYAGTVVQNNTCYANTAGLTTNNNPAGHTGVIVQNNIFSGNVQSGGSGLQLNDPISVITTHQNNHYSCTNSLSVACTNTTIIVTSGANNYSFNTVSTYEASAARGDPVFINSATTSPWVDTNFKLQNTSPDILTAIDLSAQFLTDYSTAYNSASIRVASQWDMGAWAFTIGAVSPGSGRMQRRQGFGAGGLYRVLILFLLCSYALNINRRRHGIYS